jgi:hypothetical protein
MEKFVPVMNGMTSPPGATVAEAASEGNEGMLSLLL